eukprot:jgi/Chrzof1/1793/Cz10g21100.t1
MADNNDNDDGPPPGFAADDDGPPPGFPGSKAVEDLAAGLQDKAKVDEEQADEPDLALRLSEGLRNPETDITTHTHDSIYTTAGSFEELPISQELLQGIYVEMKFEHPSRIQALTLPMILKPDSNGRLRDLIAQAHNGSGKTTCFVLSMLSRVDPNLQVPQALCMCPTRELVIQNLQVLQKMSKYTNITAVSTADWDPSGPRRNKIKEQVVIGTHGKMKNWFSNRLLDPDNVSILVFDEADEMLKADAFADDSVRMIKTIRKRSPNVQLLLFSATFNDKVKSFAQKIAPQANQVFVPKEELSLDVISQYNVRCPTVDAKTQVLKEMIFPNCEKLGQTIIFVKSKDKARQLHAAMEAEGYKCTSIQGDMEHTERDRVVKEFRSGTTKILISTDVLARGFDVSQVTLVVNYDIPMERNERTPNYETYLHRIGRSGRFGRKGAAFNLIAGPQDAWLMQSVAEYFNKHIPDVPWDNEDAFIEVLRAAGLTDQQ